MANRVVATVDLVVTVSVSIAVNDTTNMQNLRNDVSVAARRNLKGVLADHDMKVQTEPKAVKISVDL